jgi:hypothetical protein
MEKVRDELKSQLYELLEKSGKLARGKGKGGDGWTAERQKQIDGAIECIEAVHEGEAADLIKKCLSGVCEFLPKSFFCKAWNVIMWIDACAAFVAVEGGTWVVGEDLMNRFWDDWSIIADCQTMSNLLSCKDCCRGRYRSGNLTDNGVIECDSKCEQTFGNSAP